MELDEKIKKRLSKLLKLAQAGVGGEKVNAQNILDSYLTKFDLSMDDICDESKSDCWISYGRGGKMNRRLLHQVILQVCGKGIDIYTSTSKRYRLCVEATKFEHLEIEFRFSKYKNALEPHLNEAFLAFVHANNILPYDADEPDSEKLTPTERARIRRIANMMLHSPTVSINKAIEHTG